MKIKKIIKYILIASPLLFLAKCGAESLSDDLNKYPEINHHPIDKMKISGQTSFGSECKLLFNIKYVPNDKFGMRETQWIKVPTDLKKDGSYEVIVYKDYYTKKVSTWKIETFVPEFKCPGYSQGGRAMLYLSDKSTMTKRIINCTREEYENSEKKITCSVGNTHSIGFEKISSSDKGIEVNFMDLGLNTPYYKLIQ